MPYTPFSLLVDVGCISGLMVVGVILRRFVPLFQRLLLPASITAGLLGIVLGPAGLGLLPLSDQLETYGTILIAVVMATVPFSETFGSVARSARTTATYSIGAYVLQWGLAIVFAGGILGVMFALPSGFGILLPAGWAGGFGTAAALGSSMESQGFEGANSLGFTSATIGAFTCIVGGIAIAKWGAATGKFAEMSEFKELPGEMRHGLVVDRADRDSVGTNTSSPSSIESLGLHAGLVAVAVLGGYLITEGAAAINSNISIPLFGSSFLVALVLRMLLVRSPAGRYVDSRTVASISGASTDYLVAFGIAAIVPSIVVDYAIPLLLLMAFGLAYCLFVFRVLTPKIFKHHWLERGLFCWGWSTASVATAIALLRIVDPKRKTGTIEEFGLAYVGFAPVEVGVVVAAPIALTSGLLWGFAVLCIVLGIGALMTAVALGRREVDRDRYPTG